VLWIAGILEVALVASSIRVEECRIKRGAFLSAFSSAFDVSRNVCDRMSVVVAIAARTIAPRGTRSEETIAP
jgi:hypothetical protein